MPSPPLGRIITFYSYKGGTGRSMAVANIAWILAGRGRRVLVIDWDLEAPGLHRYFRPFLIDEELSSSEGLIDIVDNYANEAIRPLESDARPDAEWYREYADFTPHVLSVNFEHFAEGGRIDFLPAGRQGDAYALKVGSFNWQNFYDRLGGGGFFEAFKSTARTRYDYVLIDSRTGVSDTAGICSVQMPDSLVVCFTYNNQSIKGAAAVARSAVKMRSKLVEEKLETQGHRSGRRMDKVEDTPRPYRVFPVPMRVDPGESERLAVRQVFAREAFGDLIGHLGPSEIPEYWRAVEVPQTAFYSYEEVLAPFKDEALDPKTVLAAFVRLSRYITDHDVTDYRLPIAPDVKQRLLQAFAETPATIQTKKSLAQSRTESDEEARTRRADAAFARLDDEERRIALNALGRLVRLGSTEEGGGYFPILATIDDFSEAERAILSKLFHLGLVIHATAIPAGPGRSQSAGEEKVGLEERVGLADERLLKAWKTLREWLDGDREFLLWRQQLRTYLADWQRSGNDEGALLSGRVLSEADLWAVKRKLDLNPVEIGYITASRRMRAGYSLGAAMPPPAVSPTAIRPTAARPAVRRPLIMGAAAVVVMLVVAGSYWLLVKNLAAPFSTTVSSETPAPRPLPDRQAIQALIEQGDRLLESGDTTEALASYSTAANLDPANVSARVGLGRVHDGLGDFVAARREYDEAVRLEPNNARALFARGASRTQRGDYKNGLVDLDRAISIDRNDPLFYVNRAVARGNLGDTEGARADYSSAIRLKPDYAEAYLNRGQLDEKVGDKQAAIADYRSVLALNITDPGSRTAAAARLRALGAPESPRPSTGRRGIVSLLYNDRNDERTMAVFHGMLARSLGSTEFAAPQLVSAPSNGDVWYFFREDEKLAWQVKNAVEPVLAKLGYKVSLRIVQRDARASGNVQHGTINVWLPSLHQPVPAPPAPSASAFPSTSHPR